MGRHVGQTDKFCAKRDFVLMLYLSDGEKKKLEKTAWLQGVSCNEFVRKAIEDEYKKILNEEVRQYEHSGMRPAVFQSPRKPDPDDSERGRASGFGDIRGKAGTEGGKRAGK